MHRLGRVLMATACWLALFDVIAAAEKAAAKPAPTWKAGAACVTITPQKSLWMAGYASRTRPSEGVAQDLFAKALALEDDCGTRLVIVTMDLIGVQASMRAWLEGQLQAKHQLPPQSLLLNASHTHCGPELRPEKFVDSDLPADQAPAILEYNTVLQQNLLAVVSEALGKLQPARLDYLHARCGFAINRRRPTVNVSQNQPNQVGRPSGTETPTGSGAGPKTGYSNAPHIDGPVDHDVPVLRVSDAGDKLVALLFGYACHSTTMGDYQFRGDYGGYAQQYLQEAHPDAIAMFMAGCGGDQNPYPRRHVQYCLAHGRSLATAVEAALETVPKPLTGPLNAALEKVVLDFAPPPSKAELERLAEEGKRPRDGHAKRLLKQLAETGRIRSTYDYPVQVVRFGSDLTLVALAGEVVVDYSLRLKKELAGPAVWVAGYSNDVFGYVPSVRVLKEGGYEAGDAMFWGSLPGPFTDTIEERIVGKARQLAKE